MASFVASLWVATLCLTWFLQTSIIYIFCAVLSLSVVSDSLQSHGWQPARLLCPWDSPGKNTGVGCHALIQGIFPAQGSNSGLPRCRQIHQGSQRILEYVAYPFFRGLPIPGIKPGSPALQSDCLPAEQPGQPTYICIYIYTHIHIYVCMYMKPLCICVYICIYTYMNVCICIFVCSCTHTHTHTHIYISDQSLSRVRLFATPWIAACQASLSITNSQSSLRLMSIESVMPSSYLILCHPLLLLPPITPSISVFSNESTFHMRWPKYWSFSFSIIPSKEIPGLISFRRSTTVSPSICHEVMGPDAMILVFWMFSFGVGEDSWESLGLQGDPTSPFWRRSALGFLWKEWC